MILSSSTGQCRIDDTKVQHRPNRNRLVHVSIWIKLFVSVYKRISPVVRMAHPYFSKKPLPQDWIKLIAKLQRPLLIDHS